MASEWQPIETAPKDGTSIIVYCRFGGRHDYAVVIRRREEWMVDTEDGWLSIDFYPTHWMTLPEPPT